MSVVHQSLAAFLAVQPQDTVAAREVTTFKFLEAPAGWVIALVIVPAIVALAVLAYRRERAPLSTRQRGVLSALRVAAFAVLLVALFRPVLETQQVEVEKSALPILFDGSASMTRADAYSDEDIAAQLVEASGLASHAALSGTPRVDVVKAALRNVQPALAKLSERNDVRLLTFGDELRALDSIEEWEASANSTRLGSAIADALSEFENRGDRVSEMIVISDGRSNSGLDLSQAAQIAALDGVRVHCVGVGDPDEPRNVTIEAVSAPDVALVNDDVGFEVSIVSNGYEGRVTSLMLKERGGSDILASKAVTLAQTGRIQVETLYWRPERDGEFDLEIEIEMLAGEQFQDDNRRSHHLRVDPEQIKVLYVEGYPRWEYRYLMSILLRSKNFNAQCLLLDADKDFIQESTAGTPALTAFPPTKEDLFEYDVVILGDVNAFRLRPTAQQSEQALRDLRQFVELGGGIVFVAGELENPLSYVGTPLEDLLPIVVGDDPEDHRARLDAAKTPFRPVLENPLDPPEPVRLEKDLAMNRELWSDPEVGMPQQEWYFAARKAKGGAEVMLRHPENGNQFGKHVLLASTWYPAGRTIFVAFDSTWLWRKYYGSRYTERFWRGVVRYVGLNKLRRTNKRFDLATDKSVYDIHEPIRISARIRTVDFGPLTDAKYSAQLADPRSAVTPIELTNVDATEGQFQGTIRLALPGNYQVWLEDFAGRDAGRLSPKSFRVEVPRREWENPVLARDALEQVAATTRARYFGLHELEDAIAAIEGDVRERLTGEPRRRELWSSWYTLLLFLALLSAEWILRKKYNLI
jgi:von Willebrand factor type A domain